MKLPLPEMEGLQGKHHKHKHQHGKDKDIPDDWKEKCPNHEDWCDQFLLQIIKKKEVQKLFGKLKPPKLTPAEKAVVKKACKEPKYRGKKWCKKVKNLEVQLWDDRKQLRAEDHGHGHKRSANEAAEGAASLAVWLAVGGLFLLVIVAALVLYFCVCSGKKKDGSGKGSISKGAPSKLKSRRSKSGKSALACQSSGKRSQASKKKSSKNLGSKKSSNKK